MSMNILKYCADKFYRLLARLIDRHCRFLSDRQYAGLMFRANMGYWMDWDSPKTYNEKLQWLKVFYHDPLWTKLVDKYEVKDYVAKAIGTEYIIPTLGVWNSFNEIDFDKLPNQFVLKCTHDSGGLVICKDKSSLDIDNARKKITRSLSFNYYWRSREWPYKNVKPRIIAEQYMEDSQTAELRDYKIFAFDGKVKALFVASDRNKKGEEVKFDYFDENFNHLDLRQAHPMANKKIAKPVNFEKMKELAAKLSQGLPEARCDFYEVDGKVYFGEITFFHHGGNVAFHPSSWDEVFGSWIKLPSEKMI